MMFITAVGLAGNAARAQRVRSDSGLATTLAHDLLAEIVARRYEEPVDTSTPDSPEPTEGNGTRINFDDVDDYNGWIASPPQHRDGTIVAHAVGWERAAATTWADPDTAQEASVETGLRRIIVTVTSPSGAVTEASALRSRNGPLDRTTTYAHDVTGAIEVAMQPSSGGSAVSVSIPMLNQPGPMATNMLKNPGTEDGLAHWIASDCALTSMTDGYVGLRCIQSTFRASPAAGPEQNLGTSLAPGQSYLAELWVNAAAPSSQIMRLRIEIMNDAGDVTSDSFDVAVPPSTWTHISGTLTPVWTGDIARAMLRIESASGTFAFRFDQAVLEPAG